MSRLGRPKKRVTKEELRKLCEIRCTLKEVAYFFNCSDDTIERRCKQYFKLTFAEFRNACLDASKIVLRRTAFKRAIQGSDSLLKTLLKELNVFDEQSGSHETTDLDRKLVDEIPKITEKTDPHTASQIYKDLIKKTKE